LDTGQKFLSFQLADKDTAVIPIDYITEVFPMSLTEICGVPEMPDCLLGIYNWRSEMLWLLDLEDMLGYTAIDGSNSQLTMMTIVIRYEGKSLGLVVRKLLDIEWLNTEQMNLPDATLFRPQASPWVNGYFINDLGEMVIKLDATAIIQSPQWNSHNS
jgi:positive phototaxis protein PixI